jgi:hypothetical protein
MSTDEQLQQHLDNDPQKPINPVSAYLTSMLPDYLWKLVHLKSSYVAIR